jgi:hypothetical protein
MDSERRESILSQLLSERPSYKACKQLLGWIAVGAAMALLCAGLIIFILIFHIPEVCELERDKIRSLVVPSYWWGQSRGLGTTLRRILIFTAGSKE